MGENMRKLLPKECLDGTVRNLTTCSAYNMKKLSETFLELEHMCDFSPTNKTHIVLHHSLTKDSRTVSWNPIREYHIEKFNTDEIGYHFGIEEVRKSDVYEIFYGRRINRDGIHCPQNGMNRLGVGFMFCGNFDETKPPELMLDKASSFIADVCTLTGIPPENIHGHRHFNNNKSCPGNLFDVAEFKKMVVGKL